MAVRVVALDSALTLAVWTIAAEPFVPLVSVPVRLSTTMIAPVWVAPAKEAVTAPGVGVGPVARKRVAR